MDFKANLPLKKERFQVKETIATIIAENNDCIKTAKNEIQIRRIEIEQFIRKDKFFQVTFKPYKCPNNAPEIIKKMCESSERLNVGPMATVAGIIADAFGLRYAFLMGAIIFILLYAYISVLNFK